MSTTRPTIYNASSIRSSRSPSPGSSAISSAAPSPRVPFMECFEQTTVTAGAAEYISSRGMAYHVYNNGWSDRRKERSLERNVDHKEGVKEDQEFFEGGMVRVVVVGERERERVKEFRR